MLDFVTLYEVVLVQHLDGNLFAVTGSRGQIHSAITPLSYFLNYFEV